MSHGVAPIVRSYLPGLLGSLLVLAACVPFGTARREPSIVIAAPPDTTMLEDRSLSWREPPPASDLRGLRLLYDTPIPGSPTLAVVHSVVRDNHRLDPLDALIFATQAIAVAREHHLDYGFFCATLLQESAFDPDSLSPAGAVGIAQFTLDTSADMAIDPFDWRDAMTGSATLLGRYVDSYAGVYPDPYAAALGAYNAGPGSVAYYHGLPPYAETRAYVGYVYDRWARIAGDATGEAVSGR